MKIKIFILLVVVFLAVISVVAVKKHIDNSVVDKYGMVKTPEEDIVLCRYSCAGGMEGSSETLEISVSENGSAVVTYEYTSLISDKVKKESVEVSFDAIKEIRDICKRHRIFSWGELKDSEVFLLDAPVTSVYVSTGQESYSYNSNNEIPEYAYGITNELYNAMKKNLKGVD